MILSLTKGVITVSVVLALGLFARIALIAASVDYGIDSTKISDKIDQELITKNSLEVQDCTLGNSSKIREIANSHSLVSPTNIEEIKLKKDLLAYNESGDVSLVGSLKNMASHTE